MDAPHPTQAALDAFGVAAPTHLRGGQGTSWRAGALVLKPVDGSEDALQWLESLPEVADLRIARPMRAVDGRLIVDGWSASRYLSGRRVENAWDQITEAGRRFAAAFPGLSIPDVLRRRDDPWAVADRVAWAEDALPSRSPEWVRRLAGRRSPTVGEPTLIHGDLTGNTLFEPGLPPAVIDISPYFRPVEYAAAIVVADALSFENAPARTAQLIRGADAGELLRRALLFRAVTDVLRGQDASSEKYARAIDVVERTL